MTYTALRVLLIEDDPGDTYLLQTLLARADQVSFCLECANRLSTGLNYLSRSPFDIVLLELSLPDSQGLDTIVRIRAQTLDVPIVILTGLDDEDIAMQAVQAGAQDYLAKGNLEYNILTRSIRYAVERHRLQGALDRARLEEEENLQKAHDELETRVETRTAELKQANMNLQTEMDERRKAERAREDLVANLVEANRSLEALSQSVQQSHRETEQLLAAIPSMLIGIEASGRISQWNSRAEALFGLRHGDVIGRLLQTCPVPWDNATILAQVERCRQTQQAIRLNNIPFTNKDGSHGFLGLTISPIQRGPHDGPGILVLGEDITERIWLESQLAQAQKLEAIGQLAAGIAHEINTPTQYVSDNTRFLQDAFRDLCTLLQHYEVVCQHAQTNALTAEMLQQAERLAKQLDAAYLLAEIPEALQQSLAGLERIATIIQAMKYFLHPGSKEKVAIDLNEAISSTVTVARSEWKYVAELVMDLDPHLPAVPCLVGDINQVILNIVVNAAHAIQQMIEEGATTKGTITIQTRHVKPWAEIRIQDTGSGIPVHVRGKIFDPFFTTKEVGRGTGQGLTIAHAVVVGKHAGTITFDTVIGQGTTFIIRLPLEPSPLPVT
jgi:PAS domain S-box-containing protein